MTCRVTSWKSIRNFRGHKFVVVEDEIVIIEPRTRRIVTTISRSGERSVSRSAIHDRSGGRPDRRIRLRDQDRSRIRTVRDARGAVPLRAAARLPHRAAAAADGRDLRVPGAK